MNSPKRKVFTEIDDLPLSNGQSESSLREGNILISCLHEFEIFERTLFTNSEMSDGILLVGSGFNVFSFKK